MKKSFLNSATPFVTEMVQAPTAGQAEIKIRNAIADGATAIGFQMSFLAISHGRNAYVDFFGGGR